MENINLKNAKRSRRLKIGELYFKERKDAITAYDQVIREMIADLEGDVSVANKSTTHQFAIPIQTQTKNKKTLNHDYIKTMRLKLHLLTKTL